MNLFENLQIMKESDSNNEFVTQEAKKYGINEHSYGSSHLELYLEPTDSSAEDFINKIEADGYKFIEEQKDGIDNHPSEHDVTLVYGKEVGENRNIISISIHPSENNVIVTSGYNEDEGDNEFFENLQSIKEKNYGGAYDIEDDQYFTRDDLNEFSQEVIDLLSDKNMSVDLIEIYIENNVLEMTIDYNGYEHTHKEKIDMRKIRKSSDLKKAYAHKFVDDFFYCILADVEHEELIKESKDVDTNIDLSNWQYWEMPKDFEGNYTPPHYFKDYTNEISGFIHIPVENNVEKNDEYVAYLYNVVNGDEITDFTPFDDLESAKTWLDGEFKNYSEKQTVTESNNINLDEYEYIGPATGYNSGWSLYRKMVDGKGVWVAKHQHSEEIVPINYKQVQGFEPIKLQGIQKLQKDLGDMLLPKRESNSQESEYQLLDRCKSDCDYFLGAGNGQEKDLWGKTVKDHIAKMKELYNSLDEKPEWISEEDINEYEKQMTELLQNKSNKLNESDVIDDELIAAGEFWNKKLNRVFCVAGDNNLADKLIMHFLKNNGMLLNEINEFLYDLYDYGEKENVSEEEIINSIHEYLN